ncbi:MAG TPA: ATP-binding protein [Usitatibacteraceae bacterium]|nr:ATP-binding protein [Usitatibacteraceae bacterium]
MAERLRTIRSLGPWLAPLIGAGAVLLLVLVAFAEWRALRGFGELNVATERQRELLEDLASVRALENAMIEMESGMRGFVLANRDDFLEPFTRGQEEFAAIARDLRERWRGTPDQAGMLESIVALESDWRNAFADPLVERRRATRTSADWGTIEETVARGDGKRRVDAVRALASQLETQVAARIRAVSAEIGRRSQIARNFAIRTGLAVLLGIGFMAAVIARGFRTAAEQNAALSREIADRQQAELRARASESLFEAFLNGIADALVIVDDNGRIAWTNPRLPALFGFAPDELQGAAVTRLLADADHPRLEEKLAVLRGGAQERIEIEVTARSANGREFAAELSLGRFDAPQGFRTALVIRDVSERKAVERLKSEFIASVSHELRTPLTAIVGSLSLLRSGEAGEMEAGARDFVEMAHENSLRLAQLVDDVIDVERIGSGALAFREARFPLPEFLAEAVRLNQGYAEAHGVFFFLDEPVPQASLRGDRGRLMQALTNLLSNAAKFSPRGEEVHVSARLAGTRVRIAVTDRGPGIPEEFRPHVFEKFAQADGSDSREKGGTGLGLAIAHAIVMRLGGSIGFETSTGKGTTFWIEMPVTDEATGG